MRSTYTVPVEYLEQAFERKTLWVAADATDAPIGYAVLRESDNVATLFQVDVLPDHGRQGIGRSLVMKAVERAKELGHDFLYLTTFKYVPWNAPFYERLGFTIVPDADLPPAQLASLNEERALIANRIAMRKAL